ncbi:MAG TPA: Na/Pi cotransporter family protein [Lentisphaeria bacterium]|nr:Na/Pi cotransporter family protein [Lentisphaeria bacterium]
MTQFRHGLWVLALIVAGLGLGGCAQREERVPAVLRISDGNNQLGRSGEYCQNPVVVEVLGPVRQTMLGGTSRRPAYDVRINVRPLHPDGMEDEQRCAEPAEGRTDRGGNFRTKVRLGKQFGDQYFTVSCPDYPDVKPVYLRVVSGVEIRGGSQETLAGDELPAPIEVSLMDEAQQPLVGVPVFFSLASGSSAARLSAHRVSTDETGTAATQFQTADGYTGRYEIVAEIGEGGGQSGLHARGIHIKALALSRMTIIIGVLGGLGIFIYGMTLMSDGLQQMAGDRLKSLLQMFTGNRIKAMLAGLVVTSLIQSSSACSVMVIGFVNASLLNLTQAIGILLGAAIGTTVTAQMVSFKLEGLALPAVCLGVAMLLLAKKSTTKGMSKTLLGFGLLFFGMSMMSKELKVIADFPTFVRFFHFFDCAPAVSGTPPPFGAVLGAIAVGTVMTMVVQSSSATVGLTIALANSGLINFYTAVPLILGDNIGTTITGLLASVSTNRASKQAAWAATVFKIFGVIIMLPLFNLLWQGQPCFLRLVDFITDGDVFAATPENIGRHVAAAHTLFNVCNVLLFLPFIGFLEAVVKLLVPDRHGSQEAAERICYLEPYLLNTPSAALNQVLTALLNMTREAMHLANRAVAAVVNRDQSQEEELMRAEEQIDQAQHDIIDYLVTLTRRNLSENQSATIPDFMHCVNDVERIGDRAINIFELTAPLSLQGEGFSDRAIQEIADIKHHITELANLLIEGMTNSDFDAITKVIQLEREVKAMTSRFERNHEARLRSQDCTVEKGVIYVELLANLERIAAHLSNLAERANKMLQHRVDFKAPTVPVATARPVVAKA